MDKREIFRSIAADVTKGEMSFPTSAQVAMQVRRALDDPDCHIEAAAKLVQAEPLLSARVVAIANSATYNRSGREITDVRSSVTRLGFQTVRTMATALVTRQLAGKPGADAHQKLAAQLWEHTAHVASLAHVIARRVTHQNPETAMFAGIVHEVGGFYMLSRAGEFPGLLEDDQSDWIEFGEVEIGRAVLKVLSVPEAISAAIETLWDGFLSIPPSSLADTLMLADELAPIASPLHPMGGDNPDEGMKSSIDMAIGEDTLSSILAESAAEMQSLTGALK
jgi:HD-like signal output (HDOD) protein